MTMRTLLLVGGVLMRKVNIRPPAKQREGNHSLVTASLILPHTRLSQRSLISIRMTGGSYARAAFAVLAARFAATYAQCDAPPTPPFAPPPGAIPPPPWFSWVMLLILNFLSGLFSGLNLGLMSLTEEDLQIVIEGSSDPAEVRYAKKILPLRRRGNLLLCTLLIGNTLVNVMLAVLTDQIWLFLFGDGVAGDILSLAVPTVLIVVFGEIIPQAYCGRNSLYVGALFVPVVWAFVVVIYPLTKPIAMVLDHLLGREISAIYNRHGLLALVKINVKAKESTITQDDGKLLTGALTYKDRSVGDVMSPLDSVFCLPESAVLNKATILAILEQGHTRVPIHRDGRRNDIVALLFVKDIAGIGFERALPVKEVLEAFDGAQRVHRVGRHTKLNLAVALCQRARAHMLVVTDEQTSDEDLLPEPSEADFGQSIRVLNRPSGYTAVGIATLEDFLEEVIGEEIVDETDVYVDNTSVPDGIATVSATSSTRFSSAKITNSRRYDTTALLRALHGE
jgi:metal transporter CNNM